MNSRLKQIRKSLGLTQLEFGSRLGVSDAAISMLEKGVNQITSQMIAGLRNIFTVNEDWLRTGEGEMFIESESTILSQLAEQYNLSDIERKVISIYMELPASQRAVIMGYMQRVADSIAAEAAPKQEPARELTLHEQAELLRQRADALEKEAALSTISENVG